ncbi:MAG: tetratricopeptide repeat protein, partial [Blastocatellia bacterium]|nr:tetratricopeptide repeat protein [Blastocatellia bacterium]
NLAILYKRRGDYMQAESLYLRALNTQEKLLGPENRDVGTTLNSLAVIYTDRGDYAKAESMLKRAISIQEKSRGTDNPETARAMSNLARIYRDKGDYAQAEPLYLHALSIREKLLGLEHPSVGGSLWELGNFYFKRRDYEKAESHYRRALAIWEKTLGPEHPDVANALNGLALVYAAKGDITQAVKCLTRGNAVDESNLELNLSLGSERQKLAYLSLFSKRTDFTFWLHSIAAPNDPEALNLAFTTLLRRKGRGLDAMTDTIENFRRHATHEDNEILDELVIARSRLAAFKLKESDETNAERYQELLDPLQADVEKLEVKLSTRSAEFRAQARPVTIEAVQSALPAASALIEFVVFTPQEPRSEKKGPPRYLAYVLGHEGRPRWADLGEAAPIDQAVNDWRSALRANRLDAKRLGREVDEKVMRPVRALLQEGLREGPQPGSAKEDEINHLFISPDGPLNLISFAALVDEENRYLIERYTISFLTSGRDLLRFQDAPSTDLSAP